jgi:hypothetical protein
MLDLNKLIRRVRRDDEGVALVAVVGVMAVGLILASLILTSLVNGLGFTAASRASVQSQAAAEAGIAAAQAGLQITGDCVAKGGVYTPTTAIPGLDYRATIWIKNVAGTWVRGCPTATTTSVRIIAGGDARDQGIPSNRTGDESFVEAVFNIGVPVITEGPSASAIFTGSGGSVSSLSITSANSNPGDIHILKGNFQCNSGSVINGSIIVADGSADITNTCTITGSVKASKGVKISAAVIIGGDVVAANGDLDITNSGIKIAGNVYTSGNANVHATIDGNLDALGTITLQDNGWVKKNLTAGGAIEIRGKVGLNVTSPSTVQAFFRPAVTVGGSIKVGGNLKVDGMTTGTPSVNYMRAGHAASVETYVTGLSGPAALAAPTVSPWVDWSYKPADWTAFQKLVWPSNDCQVGSWNQNSHSIWKQIKDLTVPTLIDARGCSTLIINGINQAIKTDVVFIVKGISQGGITWTASDNAAHRLWFLSEDGAPTTAGPQCPSGSTHAITYGFEIKGPLKALAYTPCTMTISGTKWRGQIYTGGFAVSSGDSMVYEPIGIPGTDLSGGTFVDPNATPAGLGDLTSLYNRTDNGEPS